ncbi:MAG: SMC family ATPase [Saprospiraceae bacterium]|nr:SMC family ATPase [Saprospiraceae bacterium]
MTPKYLIIKGLYSYKSQQEIDFTKLTEGGLFGIFGNVGAGKSSILEAIMLALYGEVERMGKMNRNYNILNLSSDSLLIQFDFEIDRKLYRSKVTGRRNSKDFNDVSIKSPNFYEHKGDDFVPINIPTAESLIGLKSSDFKKTIIIPQGTFQDFLQLSDATRTEMMGKLFGLERFDLDPSAKFLQNENNNKLENQKSNLAVLGDIKQQDIDTNKVQLIDLQKSIELKQHELDQKRAFEISQKQLKGDFEMHQKIQRQFEVLMSNESQIILAEKKLDEYEKVKLHFANLLENHKNLTHDIAQNNLELSQKQENLAQNNKTLQNLINLKAEMTPQYEQREILKKKVVEIQKISSIKKESQLIAEKTGRLQKGLTLLTSKNAELESVKMQLHELDNRKKVLTQNTPNWLVLNAVNDWFTKSLQLENETKRLSLELTSREEKIKAMLQRVELFMAKDLPFFNIRLRSGSKIADVIGAVKAKIEELNHTATSYQQEQTHLLAHEKLESLAANLIEGEACPLCGATHHPSVMQAGTIRENLVKLSAQLTQIKNSLKTLNNIDQELFTLNTNINSEIIDCQKLNADIATNEAYRREHRMSFSWQPLFEPTQFEAVKNAIDNAENTEKIKLQLDKDSSLTQKNKEKIEQDIERYKTEITKIQTDIASLTASVQVLRNQIEVLNFEETNKLEEAHLKKLAQSFDNQYTEIEAKFSINENNIQKLQSEAQLLRGGIEALLKSQSQLIEKEKAIANELSNKLVENGYSDVASVASILSQKIDTATERKRIEEFKNQKLVLSAQLDELRQKMQGKTFIQTEYEALLTDIQKMDAELKAHLSKVGELNREIWEQERRLSQRIEIEKQQKETLIRAENIKILRGLFYGKGFVNYASSKYLNSIIHAANQRFMKLTKQQLSLQITENNNFIIHDLLNGGKVRDVRTLSGGQTFQAALCLALSLSDHIQIRNQAQQNFFFLDEGFGSLDKETLQTVFDTLKALRKENRIVGIISHVEEMRSEIDRYLNVRLTDADGSKVELILG